MKIFAKRKRKAAPAGTTASAKERDSFASDPIVEELLTKDPKEWNSKERRMIKRYQDRKAESLEANSDGIHKPEESESVEKGKEKFEEDAPNEDINSKIEGNDSDDDDDESSSDSDGEGPTEKIAHTQPSEATTEKVGGNDETATPAKWTDEPTAADEKTEEEDGGVKVNPEHEVYKLLDKLNSKMKRTLSRKLERQGATALDEVESEAKKLLGGSTDAKESKKRGSGDVEKKSGTEENQSNKKSKKEVDWSNLSAEERLRREEQRRKQNEALERRANGEDKTPGYKHPLNSERRRANRRKPKWKNGTPSSGVKVVKNEHNYSGYAHRKQPV